MIAASLGLGRQANPITKKCTWSIRQTSIATIGVLGCRQSKSFSITVPPRASRKKHVQSHKPMIGQTPPAPLPRTAAVAISPPTSTQPSIRTVKDSIIFGNASQNPAFQNILNNYDRWKLQREYLMALWESRHESERESQERLRKAVAEGRNITELKAREFKKLQELMRQVSEAFDALRVRRQECEESCERLLRDNSRVTTEKIAPESIKLTRQIKADVIRASTYTGVFGYRQLIGLIYHKSKQYFWGRRFGILLFLLLDLGVTVWLFARH